MACINISTPRIEEKEDMIPSKVVNTQPCLDANIYSMKINVTVEEIIVWSKQNFFDRYEPNTKKIPLHHPQIQEHCKNIEIIRSDTTSPKDNSLALAYHEGDKIYGLQEATNPYRIILKDIFGDGNLVIDPINDVFLSAVNFKALSEKELHDLCWTKNMLGTQNKAQYEKIVHNHLNFYKDFPSIKNAPTFRGWHNEPQEVQDKFIKYCCKAGIISTITKGHTIHFVLDSFNVQTAIAKNNWKGGPETTRDITQKEIRFLYRLCAEYPELRQGIIFWKDDKQVPAPWESDPTPWQTYHPKKKGIKELALIVSQVAKK